MLNKTSDFDWMRDQSFLCDTCKDEIPNSAHGVLEFEETDVVASKTTEVRNFRIVHNPFNYPNKHNDGHCCSRRIDSAPEKRFICAPLSSLVGQNCFPALISLLEPSNPFFNGKDGFKRDVDVESWITIAKRVTTSNYDFRHPRLMEQFTEHYLLGKLLNELFNPLNDEANLIMG